MRDKENELLTDKQSNEKLISDNLTSSMPVAVSTKKNKKSAKLPPQAKSKVVRKAFKKANDSKENGYLINKQSNEQLTTENCKKDDLPEASPSGIPMPVSTQEKKECAKLPTQAKSKVVRKAFKKANDSKENEYLINKQSNEQLTTENCKKDDLPEASPSGIPMPVSTQEKKECAKLPTQAKSKVARKAFKKANDSKENEYLINKQSNEQLTTENCNGHDLPEISSVPMPVLPIQAKSKVEQKTFNETNLAKGQEFSSYFEVLEALQIYQNKNYVQFYKRNSLGIQAAAKRCPKKKFSPELKYSEVDFRCVHGGKKFKSQSKGVRPNKQYVIKAK